MNPAIGPPPENSSAAPRQAVSPPSVTTNGGTLSRVIASPCTAPAAMPTAIAASMATIAGYPASAACPTANRLSSPPLAT